MAVEVGARPDVQPDGTPGSFGRIWYQGKQVRRATYGAATGIVGPARTAGEDEGPAEVSGPSSSPSAGPSSPSAQDDDVLGQFAEFAAILGRASAKQAQRTEAIDGIEKLLGKLAPGDYPELADHPVVQKFVDIIRQRDERQGERKPGAVSGDGLAQRDEPWRMEDVMKRATDPTHPDYETFRLVEWPGRETKYLGWNGLSVWVFEDRPSLIPKVFMDVYNESRRQQQAAKQHQDYLFAKRGLVGGAGPSDVPADPTIMAGPGGVTSRMLRGQFSGGEFTPGGGLGVEVPDGDRPGMDTAEGEGGDEGEAA